MSKRLRILLLCVLAVCWLDCPRNRACAEPEQLDPERMEYAGFPIIAGNTDIGVQFGAAATITRFHDALTPYLWNVDILASTSVKDDAAGLRFVQQSDVLRLDTPHLLGGRLRLDTRASWERTVNDGYYGIGNVSALPALSDAVNGPRRFQYLFNESRVRSIARIHTGTPFDIGLAGAMRYVVPTVYANSKLQADQQQVRGTRPTALFKLGAGMFYDTRDTEFVTQRGFFYQLGVAGTLGTSSEQLRYGEFAAVLCHYVPLAPVLTFAARAVTSFQLGHVPIYDLAQGGVFEPQRLFGGESGLRGVPLGRYAGAIKALANLELRTLSSRFELLGQRVRVGSTTFVDVGRIWADYAYDAARDGSALGLKYGIGAGGFLQWGDAAIFRIEAAYSPDAAAGNPGLPLAIYAADGLMF